MVQPNQNPEQKARDTIDSMLAEAGWRVQDNKKVDFNAGPGIAVREFQTDMGPADYALFVDRKAVGQTLPEALLWLWHGYPVK